MSATLNDPRIGNGMRAFLDHPAQLQKLGALHGLLRVIAAGAQQGAADAIDAGLGLVEIEPVDDQRALVERGEAVLFQPRDHLGDQRIGIGFALPLVEDDAQAAEFARQADFRDLDKMLPERAIAGPARLEFRRRRARGLQHGWRIVDAGHPCLRKPLHQHASQLNAQRVATACMRGRLNTVDAADFHVNIGPAALEPAAALARLIVALHPQHVLAGFAEGGVGRHLRALRRHRQITAQVRRTEAAERTFQRRTPRHLTLLIARQRTDRDDLPELTAVVEHGDPARAGSA